MQWPHVGTSHAVPVQPSTHTHVPLEVHSTARALQSLGHDTRANVVTSCVRVASNTHALYSPEPGVEILPQAAYTFKCNHEPLSGGW